MDSFSGSRHSVDYRGSRSSPASSEASLGLEQFPINEETNGRRRHIVRSGGRNGVEILTAYKPSVTQAITSHGDKRPREDLHRHQQYTEEGFARMAISKLSERCIQALEIFTEAKQRQAQNSLLTSDRPYATVEHLMEAVRKAAMRFLAEQDAMEEVKRQMLPAMMARPQVQPQQTYADPALGFGHSQPVVYACESAPQPYQRNTRPCLRETASLGDAWKDKLVDEAWNSHDFDNFDYCRLFEDLPLCPK